MAHPNDLELDSWRRSHKGDPAVDAQVLPHPHEKHLPGNRRHAKPGKANDSTTSTSNATCNPKTEPESLASGPSPQSPAPSPGANGAIESVPETLVTGSNRARNVSEGPTIPDNPHPSEEVVPTTREAMWPDCASGSTRIPKTEPESLGSGPGSPSADTAPPLEYTIAAQAEPWSSGHGHTETLPAHRNASDSMPVPISTSSANSAAPRGICSNSPVPDLRAEDAPVQSGNLHTHPSHTASAVPQLTDNESFPLIETLKVPANGEVTECNNTGQNNCASEQSDSQTPAPDPGAERPRFTRDQKYVLNHVAMGGTLCTAAEDLNCTPQRFYNWKRRVKHFGLALVEARELYTKRVADGFHEAETDARMLIHDIVRDQSIQPHIRLRAALAIMRRKKNSNWLPDPIEPEPDRHSYAHIPEEPEDDPIDQGPKTWTADTWPAGTNPDISTETAIASEAMWSTSASKAMRNTKTEPESLGSGPGSPSANTEEPLEYTIAAQAEPWSLGHGHTETPPIHRNTANASAKLQSPEGTSEAPCDPGTEPESSGSGPGSLSADTAPPLESTIAAQAEPWSSGSASSPQSPAPNPGANGAIESVPGTLVTGSLRARNVSEGPTVPDPSYPREETIAVASVAPCDPGTEPESSGSGPGSPTADTAPPLEYTIAAQAEPESSGHGHNGASEAMRHTSRVSGLEKIAGVRSEPERAETPGTNSERSETMEHLPLAASATPSGHIVAVDRTPPTTASVSACSATPRETWSETSPQSQNPNPGAQRHTRSASPRETPGATSHRESRLTDYTVLAGESRIHFHELHAELQRSYEPKSPVEELTVLRLTQVFWVLRRLDGIETAVWDSDVEIQRTTNPRIPVVAALALSYLDINENQRTRFQQRLQKMRAVHERRVDELTNQLLRFRSQRENRERHDQRREERPEWQKTQATKAKHRHHYRPDDEIPGPSLFNRDAGEHLSARINPIQQTRAF